MDRKIKYGQLKAFKFKKENLIDFISLKLDSGRENKILGWKKMEFFLDAEHLEFFLEKIQYSMENEVLF